MSSTSVTTGPICVRSAVHRSIQLKLLAWFPIDRWRISAGAQSQISTEGHGALTMATLICRRTRGWETFQRSDPTGDLEGRVSSRKSSLVAESNRDPLFDNRDIAVRVTETTDHFNSPTFP